jgi:hypothetical protein
MSMVKADNLCFSRPSVSRWRYPLGSRCRCLALASCGE